jgi:hypothetical protein
MLQHQPPRRRQHRRRDRLVARPPRTATLSALVRAGRLDLGLVRLSTFDLRDLNPAMDQAAKMRGLDCTVVTMAAV